MWLHMFSFNLMQTEQQWSSRVCKLVDYIGCWRGTHTHTPTLTHPHTDRLKFMYEQSSAGTHMEYIDE